MVMITMPMQSLPAWDDVRRGVKEATSSDISPVFWRSFLALALILSASSLMNIAVFPRFDAIFTYARDISVVAGGLSLAAIGAVAMFRPGLFTARAMLALGAVPLAGGAACLAAGLLLANAPLLVIGSCLLAAGRGVATVSVGLSLSRLTLAQASLCIALAFVAEYVITVLGWILPSWMGVVGFLAFPLVALWSVWRWAAPALDEASSGPSPAEVSITQPRTVLSLGSQLFVCLFIFHLAFGFSLRFGGLESSSIADIAGIVPVAIVALYVLTMHRQFSTDMVARISVVLIVAGFLAASLGTPAAESGSAVLLVAGSTAFDMVAWLVLVAVSMRNRLASVTMFAWGHGVGAIGSVAGAFLGVEATSVWGGDGPVLSVVAGVIVLVIVAYALIGLRSFSFAQVVGSIASPVAPDKAGLDVPDGRQLGASEDPRAAEKRFEACCEGIADRFGLSPREREVFAMLARGRDRAYIERQLTVSRNTVKTHVKHIYAKLDIHSHQDLIDLVEEELA